MVNNEIASGKVFQDKSFYKLPILVQEYAGEWTNKFCIHLLLQLTLSIFWVQQVW